MSGKIPILKNKALAYEEDSSKDDECFGNDLGISLERLNVGLRKKLVVMDLGGVLVHRMYGFHHFEGGLGMIGQRITRLIFQSIAVLMPSPEISRRNIDSVLNSLARGLKDKFLFVWDQEECTDSGFKSLEKKEKPIFFKELRKLWEDGKFSSSNTLLIEMSPTRPSSIRKF